MISFFISGTPRPGGSKTATVIRRKGGEIVMVNGRPLVTTREAGKHTKEWRAACSFTARQAYQGEPLTGPIMLNVEFIMPRPKSHYGSGKNADKLKASAPVRHTQTPDCTKLVRALEDSFAGILWRNDAQICAQFASKSWGVTPGAKVLIREAETAFAQVENGQPKGTR